MMSWIVKMTTIWQPPPPSKYFDPLKNWWQSFVCNLYLVDKIYLETTKSYPIRSGGQNIVPYFDPPLDVFTPPPV